MSSLYFFFSSRRRHTRYWRDWSSDVCSSDLHSLGNNFGCGAVAGETGLLLNDFAWWFDLDPESPNVLAPNKPVEQCLSPCQVFQDSELRYAIGTPGGHGILQTTTQMLVNLMDFGMNVQEAI